MLQWRQFRLREKIDVFEDLKDLETEAHEVASQRTEVSSDVPLQQNKKCKQISWGHSPGLCNREAHFSLSFCSWKYAARARASSFLDLPKHNRRSESSSITSSIPNEVSDYTSFSRDSSATNNINQAQCVESASEATVKISRRRIMRGTGSNGTADKTTKNSSNTPSQLKQTPHSIWEEAPTIATSSYNGF